MEHVNGGWLRPENKSGELQVENYGNGIYTEYNSGWLQMENVSGELQMEE